MNVGLVSTGGDGAENNLGSRAASTNFRHEAIVLVDHTISRDPFGVVTAAL